MENEWKNEETSVSSINLFGRDVIKVDEEVITRDNVVSVLNQANIDFTKNQLEINYLYKYYKGVQPVLARKKKVREDINNKIVENRAYQIVSFKTGYLMGQPIQYVSAQDKDDINSDLLELNKYARVCGKSSADKKLVEWMHICGTGYRMVLPRKDDDKATGSPFKIYQLDPRYTYVAYANNLDEEPVIGVKLIEKRDRTKVYSVYTKDSYFEIINNRIVKEEAHMLGRVPIIEYPLNESRIGAFEIVIPLLNAINTVDSNRVDGLEQFVQAIMVLKGVDIDSESFTELKEQGGLKVPPEGDVKYLVEVLDQSSNQTLKQDMYEAVLTITGMPNRNGGTSTSDTGAAVTMRDGWSDADARALDTERMFVSSELKFLDIACDIVNTLRDESIDPENIDIKFTRRNYENVQEKSQVLVTMLANDKIAPKLAFEHCGMFSDPTAAYLESQSYYDEQMKRNEEELKNAFEAERDIDVQDN